MVLCPILLLLCCRITCHDECLLYDISTSGLQTDPSLHEFIYYMDSEVADCETMWILISWLLQKQADLDPQFSGRAECRLNMTRFVYHIQLLMPRKKLVGV